MAGIFSEIKNERGGFTLIEVLVVVSIIGFIYSSTVVVVNRVTAAARDARRFADLKQLEKAIELYYDDNNQYPPIDRASTNDTQCGTRWCNLEAALAPYMSEIPRDPLGLQTVNRYYYDADPNDNYQSYGLMCRLEYPNNFYRSQTDGGYYSAGAQIFYYETGPQPPYCFQKYSGANGNWWSSTNACVGGN